MENLKAIIVFLLFWSIAIWCVRVVKRKHKKQIMKFSEELPEMELVTDEEERKIVSVDQTAPGRSFHVQLSDGKITGEVKAVEKQEAAGKI